MISNLEKYKKDLEKLIEEGKHLLDSMCDAFASERFRYELKKYFKDKKEVEDFLKKLPSFIDTYQTWYSEALTLLNQLLPIRVPDFIKLYEKPKTKRKDITYENYAIEDALQGLHVTRGWGKEKVVGADAAIPRFRQQLNIIKSVKRRFVSSLFDIKQLVKADLFDSELECAKELNIKGYQRGAGAIAGVVLEKHLSQVCDNHSVKITKKKPTIVDYNDKLKETKVYETPTWRKIQHLGDLRNLCDHDKKKEPKTDDVDELIEGVEKIAKTLF